MSTMAAYPLANLIAACYAGQLIRLIQACASSQGCTKPYRTISVYAASKGATGPESASKESKRSIAACKEGDAVLYASLTGTDVTNISAI